ncbi:MAG: DUF1501 domain-containing protein [Planctomycetes bacterium]|nr:DUF1501 domain-containing protein [Planctomycetota bacterium]
MSSHRKQRAALLTRREMLLAGSLGAAGLSLPRLLAAESNAGGSKPPRAAKNCIILFLEGGPSHVDLWDMKPDAPANVRGEFKPIETTVPGVQLCEHLPLLARQMHHVALIRSVHHKVVDHNAGAYYALTGRSPVKGDGLILGPDRDNFPPFGSVLAKLRPVDAALPAFVHLPDIMFNNGNDLPGELAGFLGGAYDPLVIGDPSAPKYEVPGLVLPKTVSRDRLNERRELLAKLNTRAVSDSPQAARMENFRRKAIDLLSSSSARRAFDLSAETAKTRERYGLPDRVNRSTEARKFGGLPHLGQCMLMARRLVESGVRLVTVCSGRRIDQAWDTHRDHFPLLKRSLLPYTDRALSALLEDLAQSGLLKETLVVVMGEFGRTPRLGQVTSNAGAAKTGRDHWPHCYSIMLAGGPVRGGTVFGASDRIAAYPKTDPVTPEDIAATIYQALGIDPETRIYDRLRRPQTVALGEAIGAIM